MSNAFLEVINGLLSNKQKKLQTEALRQTNFCSVVTIKKGRRYYYYYYYYRFVVVRESAYVRKRLIVCVRPRARVLIELDSLEVRSKVHLLFATEANIP